MLRTFWRFITSVPRELSFMFVLNEYEQLCVGRLRAADAETALATIPPRIAVDTATFIEKLDINFMFIRFYNVVLFNAHHLPSFI
jgi:hypothetical protein